MGPTRNVAGIDNFLPLQFYFAWDRHRRFLLRRHRNYSQFECGQMFSREFTQGKVNAIFDFP